MAETRAGTITVDVELLLTRFQQRLQQARAMAEQALGSLSAQTALQVSFNTADLQRDLQRARQIIEQATEQIGAEATINLRARVDQLQADLNQAEQVVEQAVDRIGEQLDFRARMDVSGLRAQTEAAQQTVRGEMIKLNREATVDPTLRIARLEPQLDALRLQIIEAFKQVNAQAVVQATANLAKLRADLAQAERLVAEADSRMDAEAVVDARINLLRLKDELDEAAQALGRGFLQARDQSLRAIQDLNARGGGDLESFGARIRSAFNFQNFINNPLFNASFWLFLIQGVISTGLGTVQSLTQAISGDVEKAAETLKNTPGPVGALAQQFDAVLREVTGLNQELAEFERRNQTGGLLVTLGVKVESQTREALDQLDQQITDLLQKQELLTASPDERASIRTAQDYEDLRDRVVRLTDAQKERLTVEQVLAGEELEAFEKAGQAAADLTAKIEAQQARIRSLQADFRSPLIGGEDLAAITSQIEREQEALAALQQQQASYQRVVEGGNTRLREAREAIDAKRDALLELIPTTEEAQRRSEALAEQERLDAELFQLDAEILRNQLELEGRNHEARLAQLAAFYDARIRQAQTAAEQERQIELFRLAVAQAEEDEARRVLRQEQDVLDLQSELRQAAFESEGRVLDARVERLRRFYERQVALAENATEEQIRLLLELRDAEINSEIERARERERERQEQLTNQNQDLQTEVQAELLRQQGRTLEAELLRIQNRYRQLIEDAVRAGDEAAAEQLRKQQGLEEQLARLRERSAVRGEDFTDSIGLPVGVARALEGIEAAGEALASAADAGVPAGISDPGGEQRVVGVNDERRDGLLREIRDRVGVTVARAG